MRKLILGIFAVVCVQFAFVIYTTLQSPMEVAVGPVHSDPQIALVDPGPTESEATEESMPQTDEPSAIVEPQPVDRPNHSDVPRRSLTSVRADEPRPSRSRVEEPVRRSAEYFPATSELPAQAGGFETVVINYDRSGAISDCGIEEAPKPRKRSYIAKAAPVIKKPWEWLKSVGSRLN